MLAYHTELAPSSGENDELGSHETSSQHEALLGEIDFVKHLVRYALLNRYIKRVTKFTLEFQPAQFKKQVAQLEYTKSITLPRQ